MIRSRHVGSFWLNTGTPHGEPFEVGLVDGVGSSERAALAASPALGSGDGPTGPDADSTPWSRPTCPADVQHRDAVWPRVNTSSGSSAIFAGPCGPPPPEPTLQTSK